jgi:hypothetical protein
MFTRWRQALWIALFVCFLIGFGTALWHASQQSPPNNNKQPSQAENKNAPPREAITEVRSDEGHTGGQEKEEWYERIFEKPTDWLLALFTLFLVIYTRRLYQATADLRQSTDKLWEAGERQIEAVQKNADRQFEITQQSIKLARDEFISTHRPRIILREAIIGAPLEGQPISVHFHLANVGETTGRIIRSSVKVEVVPRAARLLLHGSVETQYDLGEVTLSPGTAILLKFEGQTPNWEPQRFAQKSYMTADGGAKLYRDATIHFFGQFIYVDQLGIWRRTAFRRELNPESQRFYRIPDEPDLDYRD